MELLARPTAAAAHTAIAAAVRGVNVFRPRLEILPEGQRRLWPSLGFTREDFVLYGGTAIALRLAHRVSRDFDFFSFRPFEPAELIRRAPWLGAADRLQWETNTLTVLHRGHAEPVKASFSGGLTIGQIAIAEESEDGVLRMAGLADLMATKLNTVYQRAEAKDYLDIHALLATGISLREGLEYVRQVYGPDYNTLLPLQALCYFEEAPLRTLPDRIKQDLIQAVQSLGPSAGIDGPRTR
jgi:hypothetical protein